MSTLGINRVVYGVEDIATCRRFFLDWGLKLIEDTPDVLTFETLNGGEVVIRRTDDPSLVPAIEPGSTVRQVVWGVESLEDLDRLRVALRGTEDVTESSDAISCIDPNGMSVVFHVSRKRDIDVRGVPVNVYGLPPMRIDSASRIYDRAEPIEIGHIVFFVENLAAMESFYVDKLGFVPSDRYVGRSCFLRCAAYGGHHDTLFIQLPTKKRSLNHVAFTVRDIHEVFGGGLNISRLGWQTEIGPGRHPISSAYFWYVKCPAGGNIEYYSDEDQLTPAWKPREVETKPENFAEWAIQGGLDGHSRRQKQGPSSEAGAIGGQAAGKN